MLSLSLSLSFFFFFFFFSLTITNKREEEWIHRSRSRGSTYVGLDWRRRMPRGGFSGSISSPRIDVAIDMGNPFLNRTVDGFLKIGAVGACKVAAEDTFDCLHRGDVSKHKLEHMLKKMCKEGAYWGTVAGVYVGMEYGVERIRGRHDWKNAMIGGALSGALISAASNNHKDKIIKDAITGGAVATAVEFINYLT